MSNLNRRSFIELSLAALAGIALQGCGSDAGTPANDASATTAEDMTSEDTANTSGGFITSSGTLARPYEEGYSEGLHHATIEVADYGTIKVELDADVAPITVSNFAHIANRGAYDGLTFHRIIKGFMVQGGEGAIPGEGDATRIMGEFADNGIANDISHVRGTISMARAADNNSASSGFFIMHEDKLNLDGRYAGFGHVTEGIEVVDALAEVPVEDDNGTVAPENRPVITSIVMDD